jgi:catechol 2,3-dioxygenase-like lactoylglutathione lyase family enzyme
MIHSIIGIAFDCADANKLADFYKKITGWEKELSNDGWAALRTPQGILMAFQTIENYEPPVWPWESGKQQQMAHIDFKVDDLQAAVKLAIENGAKKADVQYFEDSTVMLDPDGHPFCLSTVMQ